MYLVYLYMLSSLPLHAFRNNRNVTSENALANKKEIKKVGTKQTLVFSKHILLHQERRTRIALDGRILCSFLFVSFCIQILLKQYEPVLVFSCFTTATLFITMQRIREISAVCAQGAQESRVVTFIFSIR